MGEWKKGKIIYVCNSCGKEIAREDGEIKGSDSVRLYIICEDCKNKPV